MKSKFKIGLVASSLAMVASLVTVVTPGVVENSVASASSQVALNLGNEQGELWPCNFNPYNPSDSPYSLGVTYETLDFVDALDNAKTTPWLATSYAWSNGNKTLTFTIRSGVKFTNGDPLTPADVAYSFNLMKRYPALDVNAVWSVLSSVAVKGSNQVVFNFTTSAVPYFYYVADQTPVVPESVWSKVANPVTYADSDPIGTGGYIMSKCTPENIQWKANASYWQKGDAKVETVNMPAYLSNNTCNEYLSNGYLQWGSQFIPNIQSTYVDKKAGNTYWFPPVANVDLFPNLTVPGLNNVDVRKAISYGLDRSLISKIGEYGYEPPANQTGIVSPTFSSWESSSAVAAQGTSYNVAKAKSLLAAAGYTMKNGVYEKGGKQLAFTLITNGGYSDWIASMQVVTQELAKIGIKVTLDPTAATTFYSDVYTGKYQLAYNAEAGGPTPFYELRQALYSKNSAPIGTAAASNWERYSNKTVDNLLNEYGATTSTTTQHSIIDQLESIMVSQAPIIPVLEEVDWYQYNPSEFNNFPTKSNPYAQPGLYNEPDWGYVLDRLTPKN